MTAKKAMTDAGIPMGEGQFSIDERDDDMLVAERHWQFGWRCIARRPKLVTNDEWRADAERIVAALAHVADTPPPAAAGDRALAIDDIINLDVFLAAYAHYSDGELIASVIHPTDDLLTLGELRRILKALRTPEPNSGGERGQ